jgi:hypothetical protein
MSPTNLMSLITLEMGHKQRTSNGVLIATMVVDVVLVMGVEVEVVVLMAKVRVATLIR